jgi:hypothetical protein
MDKTIGWALVGITACAITTKLAYLAYIFFFKRSEIPTNVDGPVSGWGTADE